MALIGVGEAAKRLGVTHKALYARRDKGELPMRKSGGIWLVEEEDLARIQVSERHQRSGLARRKPEP